MEDLQKLRQVWHQLGSEDPFWAVASQDDKRGGKWKPEEFFATGETEVGHLHELLKLKAAAPARFQHVLDFGSGLGRLSYAWSRRAEKVTGVDISASMIEKARTFSILGKNVSFILNEKDNLDQIPSSQFDLIASLICLQHIPWLIARNYVADFGRLAVAGGLVAFQLPTRELRRDKKVEFKRRLVDAMPFGLGRKYRKWKNGSSVVFSVYCTPVEKILEVAKVAGLQLIHQEPDQAAGADIESFCFVFRKQSPGK